MNDNLDSMTLDDEFLNDEFIINDAFVESLLDDEPSLTKKPRSAEQMLKNKASAAGSRRRKRCEINELRLRCQHLELENMTLRHRRCECNGTQEAAKIAIPRLKKH